MSENEKSNLKQEPDQYKKEEMCANIANYLLKRFHDSLKLYPSTVNEFMMNRNSGKLEDDLYFVINVCYDALMSVANKDAHVSPEAYIGDDICSICVNMFKPYFTSEHWITALHHQNRQTAAMIRQQNDLFESNDGLYCSIIKYLDQVVADSCA